MGFVGREFNVVLATAHIPVDQISKKLNQQTFSQALTAAKKLNRLVQSRKSIGVLGLNPHAGDGGLIGSFDQKLLSRWLRGQNAAGPLFPDVGFTPELRKRHGLDAELEVRQGAPARELLAAAAEHKADLIVLASHRPDLSNYFLGATADRVVRHAQCSVLVDR